MPVKTLDDQPIVRVFGSEMEYGARVASPDVDYFAELTRVSHHLADQAEMVALPSSGYLCNGARLYRDMRNIEYATPECTTLDDLVAAEFAGEVIVSRVFSAFGGKVIPHKRIAGEGRNTSGYHENYRTYLSLAEAKRSPDVMLAHLASRSIYVGAGMINEDGEFEVSQRSRVTAVGVSGSFSAGGKKPLLHLRDKPYSKDGASRLHITCGDPNISEWATRLKFGTTSLVLRMMEHGYPAEGVAFENPIEVVQHVGLSPENMHTPFEIKDCATKKSAWEVQYELYEIATRFADEFPLNQDEKQTIVDWGETLDLLQDIDDNDQLVSKLDWAARKRFIERSLQRKANLAEKNGVEGFARGVDIFYDQIGLRLGECVLGEEIFSEDPLSEQAISRKLLQGVGVAMRSQSLSQRTTERVRERVHMAPPTRAQVRSEIISACITRSVGGDKVVLDWGNCRIEGFGEFTIDPAHTSDIDISEILDQIDSLATV